MTADSPRRFIPSDDVPLLMVAAVSMVLHLGVNLFDGIFIDELYYIACSNHLGFGYVDHPPLVALIAAATRWILGESLFALRIPAALAGALMIVLAGRLTRELGGMRFAQILTALMVFLCPTYLAMSGYYSMNVFDQLFWLIAAYLLVLIIHRQKSVDWIFLGVALGIGLQNKISILFLGFGLFIGMLLTPNRRWLISKEPWICATISFLIFLPHILWQAAYEWPTREFIHNATMYKNVSLSSGQFILTQIMDMHPFFFPVWLLGLLWLFFAKAGKPYRIFAWIYVTVLILLILKRGKPYYLAPAYTVLFAAGCLAIESWINRQGKLWIKPVLAAVVILFGTITIPMALPILPAPMYIAYANTLGIQASTSEKKEIGPLPQHFADRYGWPEMVAAIATVYHDLSPEDQRKCVLIGGYYGVAGAIDYYGPDYGLPPAICPHNSYFLWGPGEKPGEIAIIVGIGRENIEKIYGDVQEAAIFDHPYKMPYARHMPIFLCRYPQTTLQEIWPQSKHFE